MLDVLVGLFISCVCYAALNGLHSFYSTHGHPVRGRFLVAIYAISFAWMASVITLFIVDL